MQIFGWVPPPIFALRGTWRAHEYSAEATDLAQLFPTHTESAAKTSSPSQPSPAQQTVEEQSRPEPGPQPWSLPSPAALPSQPSPGPVSLGPPPGTPLTCPLPLTVLPDQRHCQLTHPRPPPGLALTLPHTSTSLGDTCSSRTSTTHAPGLKLNSLGLPWRCRAQESTCQCRGRRLHPWYGEIPRATGQLNPCALTTQPEL